MSIWPTRYCDSESLFVEVDTDSDRKLGLDLNQHLNDGCITPSFSCLRQMHSWLRSTMTNERLGNLAVLAFQGFDIQLSVDQICQSFTPNTVQKVRYTIRYIFGYI